MNAPPDGSWYHPSRREEFRPEAPARVAAATGYHSSRGERRERAIIGDSQAGTGSNLRTDPLRSRGGRLPRLTLLTALAIPLALPLASQVDPATLSARDSHQGILIACDPIDDASLAKQRIGKSNPLKAGILPIDVYIRNSAKWPVAVTLENIRLEVRVPGQQRAQLEPVPLNDVTTEILHPRQPSVARRRIPSPFPTIGRGKKWQELHDKLESLSLEQAVVAPGATVHGFMFFDLNHQFDMLRYASLVVPDLKFLGNPQPLIFFEVSFSPPKAP